MSEKFRAVAAGIVTNGKEILIGKKEDGDHPIAGEYHFPGRHIDEDEEPREAVKREIEEETGLEVEVHQLLAASNTGTGAIRIIYHCEAEGESAEPGDDLEEVKWVKVEEIEDELSSFKESEIIQKDEIQNFIEKLKKMPVV